MNYNLEITDNTSDDFANDKEVQKPGQKQKLTKSF
jgi:hypothetical protein